MQLLFDSTLSDDLVNVFSVLFLNQLLSNSLAMFWEPDNRNFSGGILQFYDSSLQIKMAALIRLAFSLSKLELTVEGERRTMKVINLNHRVILNEGPIQSTEFTNTFNYEGKSFQEFCSLTTTNSFMFSLLEYFLLFVHFFS